MDDGNLVMLLLRREEYERIEEELARLYTRYDQKLGSHLMNHGMWLRWIQMVRKKIIPVIRQRAKFST